MINCGVPLYCQLIIGIHVILFGHCFKYVYMLFLSTVRIIRFSFNGGVIFPQKLITDFPYSILLFARKTNYILLLRIDDSVFLVLQFSLWSLKVMTLVSFEPHTNVLMCSIKTDSSLGASRQYNGSQNLYSSTSTITSIRFRTSSKTFCPT